MATFTASPESAREAIALLDSFDGDPHRAAYDCDVTLASLGGLTCRLVEGAKRVLTWIGRVDSARRETRIRNVVRVGWAGLLSRLTERRRAELLEAPDTEMACSALMTDTELDSLCPTAYREVLAIVAASESHHAEGV